MHPRNPYHLAPPDFRQLAIAQPSLAPFVFENHEGRPTIDFKRADAVRELTRCLLKDSFGLDVELREDRLCPTVANRLDYLLFVQDLLSSTILPSEAAADRPGKGLDVGTGSTAIYPLLGCKLSPSSSFFATEIDPNSAHLARGTISRNFSSNRITLVETRATDRLFALLGEHAIDWTMCNPPFYNSQEEIDQLAANKAIGPHAVCTGAETEMITPGGEVAFVRRMVRESLSLRDRCRWFTSLLGKFSSVSAVVETMRDAGIANYVLHEFVQGQTRRWVVGWSFGRFFAPDTIGRPTAKALHPHLPAVNSHAFHFPPSAPISRQAVLDLLVPLLAELKGVSVEAYGSTDLASEGGLVVRTTEHSWSRAARRKGKQTASADADAAEPADEFFTSLIELSMAAPPAASADIPRPEPFLSLATHFLSVSQAAASRPDDVAARRLAWDGLWLFLLRKVKDALLPAPTASADSRGDMDMT